MSDNSQYSEDRARLAELLEKHTGIPRRRISTFIQEYGVGEILPCAYKLCSTEAQRNKLNAVFEFKHMYDLVKQGEINQVYALTSREAAADYFCNYFADKKDKEYFVAAYLNSCHEVITTKTMTTGSLTSSAVYNREIIKEALFCNASSVMVAHNHPSGVLEPSPQDHEVTKSLQKGFESTGIQLLDHFVVAGDRAVSVDDTGEVFQRKTQTRISRAASPVSEKSAEYKPMRIKDQLALAQKQLESDTITKPKQTKSHDRGDR